MDPISVLVILAAAWGITRRLPGVARKVLSDAGSAMRGDGTPFADALREALLTDGIEPTSGGKVRSLLGDVAKGLLRDVARGANGEPGRRMGWLGGVSVKVGQRIRDRMDRHAGDTSPQDPFNAGEAATGDPPPPPGIGPAPKPTPEPAPPAPPAPPVEAPVSLGDEAKPEPVPPAPPSILEAPFGAPNSTATREPISSGTEPAQGGNPREPIRVHATAGQPTGHTATAVLDPPQPRQLEGTPNMANAVATNGTPITGMATGSYEMLSINRQLESATGQFVAALTAIQNRLNRAGESTLGTVQLAGGSSVMTRMAQAAEAVAALRHAAARCGGEVTPLLLQTKSEFDKRKN